MVHTIHLDHVLREEVATPYCDLVTRPTGAAVRNKICEAMARARCHTAVLDFSAVGLLDFSCADEVVAKLLREPGPDRAVVVVLGGLSEAQREAIHHVLEHQALAILSLRGVDTGPAILGRISPEAQTVFDCVVARGPVGADAVASALQWPLDRTRGVLDALTVHRLLLEESGAYRPPLAL